MVFCLVLCVMEEKAVVGWLQERDGGPKVGHLSQRLRGRGGLFIPTDFIPRRKEQGHRAVAVVLSERTVWQLPFNLAVVTSPSTQLELHSMKSPGTSLAACSCTMKPLPAPNE